MISHEQLEEFICQYPVYQYAFFSPKDIEFSHRVRWICQNECERYDTTWACPPGVGTVEECQEKCLSYEECFLFSTIASVSDVVNMKETLATRGEHEEPWDHCQRTGGKIFYGFYFKPHGNPLVQPDFSEVIFPGNLSYAVIRTISGRQTE